jgi:hypothetical protein
VGRKHSIAASQLRRGDENQSLADDCFISVTTNAGERQSIDPAASSFGERDESELQMDLTTNFWLVRRETCGIEM